MVEAAPPPGGGAAPGVACKTAAMSDATPAGPTGSSTPSPADQPLADVDLDALVTDWIDWKEAARRLEVTVAKVRTMIRDHELAAAVPRPGAGQQLPADLIQEAAPVKGLPGLLTVMHDNGYDDRECIAWLFLDQDFPGRAIDALRENRGAEVKRRAQAMAF
ncbi:MAG: hypothetical protein JWN84_4346 [Nocardioides sp.]|nr:hypothetical protein [Nocardioides sp.]